jgi:hypothetical protein
VLCLVVSLPIADLFLISLAPSSMKFRFTLHRSTAKHL